MKIMIRMKKKKYFHRHDKKVLPKIYKDMRHKSFFFNFKTFRDAFKHI